MKALSNYTLNNLAEVLGLSLVDDDVAFNSINTDTRKIKKGCLFVALKGPNFDGHDYLTQAKEKGAVAAIVDKEVNCELPHLKTKNTLHALGDMAAARRNSFQGKVIGLTGSNGKTTVKELIASVLKTDGEVLATKGNFNNEIGLPLTLLQLNNNEKFAVIEMGANHPSEIDYLSKLVRPDIALITNAGAAHLEGFGDVEGVANAKAEIFRHVNSDGIAIINLDDDYAELWLKLSAHCQQKTFSLSNAQADVYASNITSADSGCEFDLHLKGKESVRIKMALTGKHNISNALVAALVAAECLLSTSQIKQGLESFDTVSGRLTFLEGKNGSTIIDDTYNANLDSSKAAINVLNEQAGETYLVFGDLFESGEHAIQIHQEIGRYAKDKGVNHVLSVGDLAGHTMDSFGDGGKHFNNKNDLSEYLLSRLTNKSVLLVKGSRGMKMEEVVARIVC